jgi:hypothetical protein
MMDRAALQKHFAQLDAAILSDTARLANELQRQFPNMARTHALKEARRLVEKYGIGVSLAH